MSNPLNYVLGILRAQPQPCKFLVATALMRLGLSKYFTIRLPHYRLRFFPSSLSRALWLNPGARGGDEQLLMDYLRAGDLVIDAGANIGSLAIPAALQVGPQGRVHAIEAHPRTAGFLTENVRLNRLTNVRIHGCALGEKAGMISFSCRRSDDQNAIDPQGAASSIQVPLWPLDELLAGQLPAAAPLALLKIDVEGYELPVFAGAARTLARTQVVYFEAGPHLFAHFNYSARDVFAHLEQAGFTIFMPDVAGRRLLSIAPEALTGVHNLLALRAPADFIARTGYTLGA
jgi:FkbM family methyltransferase